MPILSLVFLILSFNHAFAKRDTSPVLQVGMSDIETISYLDNGKFKGINYEILRQIEKSSGLKFNYTLYPHARLQKLSTELPDITIMLAVICNKFPNDYEKSGPLFNVIPIIYLKKSVAFQNKDIRIGRIRGTCTDLINDFVKPENVVDLPNLKPAVEMLQLNRLDGICGVDVIVNDFVQKHPEMTGVLSIFQKQTQHPEEYTSVLCRKKSLPESVKAKLDKALKKIKIDI